MVERSFNPGSWQVQLIEAVSELLKQGWSENELVDLVYDVADAEQIFEDGVEPA